MTQPYLRWNSVLLVSSTLLFIIETYFKILVNFPKLAAVVDYFIIIPLLLDLFIRFYRGEIKTTTNNFRVVSSLLLFFYLYYFIKIKFTNQSPLKSLGGYNALLMLRCITIYLGSINRSKRMRHYLEQLFLKPAQTMALSYALVIFIGSLLLNLDLAKKEVGAYGYLDAFFLAVSATCITGLAPFNIAHTLTLYGQIVLLILVQLGAIGILMLSYVILSGWRGHVSLQGRSLLAYMLSDDDLKNITGAAQRLILLTFSVELVGTLLLYIGFSGQFGFTLKGFYFALFHAIGAFCNAGFSLFDSNFNPLHQNYFVLTIFIILMATGSIGFTVLLNSYQVVANKFSNYKNGHHKIIMLNLNSRIVLKASLFLTVMGLLLFYFFEHQGVLQSISTGQQYMVSFFQSVALRTAGFSAVNVPSLHLHTILFFCVWMFIGGASGSTAGGVKVTTIAVAYAGVIGFIRSKPAVIGSYHISDHDVRKAFIIIIFAATTIMMATIMLSLTEKMGLEHLVFEAVSAFSTTGLSLDSTRNITDYGKIVLMFLMFLGRIGPLTIFIILQENNKRSKKEAGHPLGHVSVG